MQKSERQLRKEEPLPEINLGTVAVQEESLAATQPHVAPAAQTKAKTKRAVKASALKRKKHAKEKGMEREQKLDNRKSSVEKKVALKKKAKQLWD